MKIYVDELPKSCGDCVFCKQTEYCYYCDKLHMKLDYIDKDKDCPLQPLADYTKQVRNELCEEVKEKVLKHFNIKSEEEYEKLPLIDSLFTADVVFEILDQIEKGEI